MGESKASTTERSNSYHARSESLAVSDKSVSAGTFCSPESWAAGGGSADPDAVGPSESSLTESTSEANCSEREGRPSSAGCLTVIWSALSLKYSVSLIEGDLMSPRRLRRMIEPFMCRGGDREGKSGGS